MLRIGEFESLSKAQKLNLPNRSAGYDPWEKSRGLDENLRFEGWMLEQFIFMKIRSHGNDVLGLTLG